MIDFNQQLDHTEQKSPVAYVLAEAICDAIEEYDRIIKQIKQLRQPLLEAGYKRDYYLRLIGECRAALDKLCPDHGYFFSSKEELLAMEHEQAE